MANIPPNQKMMLLSALGLLSAALGEVANHYNNSTDHRIYDLITDFQQGLTGFTQQIMTL